MKKQYTFHITPLHWNNACGNDALIGKKNHPVSGSNMPMKLNYVLQFKRIQSKKNKNILTKVQIISYKHD